MFFSKKNLEQKVSLLEKEIEVLKNQLSLKDKTIEEIQIKSSLEQESILKNNEKEITLFKEIAAHSQEEGLVVFNSKNERIFSNKLANTNIKDYSVILNPNNSITFK